MTVAAAENAIPVAPRSTGEIITYAVDVLRQTFPIVVALSLPLCAVDLVLRELGQHLLLLALGRVNDAATPDLALVLSLLPSLAAAIGAALGSFIVQQLLSTGVIAVGERVAADQSPTVRDAIARIGGRGAAVVLTGALFLIAALTLPGVAAAIPLVAGAVAALAFEQPLWIALAGVVGILAALLVVILVTLRWSLYGVIVATEDRWFVAALRRSAALTAARGLPLFETPRFRLSVLFLIGLALAGTLQSVFLVPRLVIAALTGWSFADGALPGLAAMPLWFMVPFGLLEVLTNAAILPFSALLLCFFTLDLRVRYEGDDLQGRPAPLTAPPPTAAPPTPSSPA
jgi:hypothetical protein